MEAVFISLSIDVHLYINYVWSAESGR